LTVLGENRSDPTSLDRDRAPNPLDLRHNLSGNLVFLSSSGASNTFVRHLLSGNEIGLLLQLNSGLPFNITANRDLNGDGLQSDRPLFVGRNSMYLPRRSNMDLRYTRIFPVQGSVKAEIVAELKNAFNIEQTSGVNAVIPTDALGLPLSVIPGEASLFPIPTGYEQRKFQLGFRLRY
jgi:hypothetical protein